MPPETVSDQQHDESTLSTRFGRLADPLRRAADWAQSHRLKAGLLVGAAAASVAVLATLAVVLSTLGGAGDDTSLAAALDALDDGRYDEARQIADALRSQEKPLLKTLAGTALVLGSVAAAKAEQEFTSDRRRRHLVAAGYLDEARDRGFPPGREAEGLFLLGGSLYSSGQYPQSRPILREALKCNPGRATEIHRLLADAYLHDANPDLAKALQHNGRYLNDRVLQPGHRHQGLLQRARILFRQGQMAECQSTLAQIPDEAGDQAEAMVVRAQVLMHDAAALQAAAKDHPDREVEALEKYQQAVKKLRTAQSRDTLAAQVSSQAMYLIGVCFVGSGDDRAAWAQLARTARTYPDTPEAVAADFQFAALAQKLARDAEAISAYRRVLRSVADPRTFSNRWITLDKLQGGVIEAYASYLEAEKFQPALELARHASPTFSRPRALELIAQTHRAWGANRMAAAAHLPPSQAKPAEREGREQLRRAGRAYQRLAELHLTTTRYSDDLWDAAEAYLEGNYFTGAVDVLNEYLRNETRHRRPRALLALGEAQLALSRPDDALEALSECIDYFPRDAAAFRARFVASRAHAENGQYDEARRLLEENLDGDALTPASAEWRDCLFALGRMLHAVGRYDAAVIRLQEAVTRYAEEPEAIEGHYLIGHCHLASAKSEQQCLATDLVQSTRIARNAKIGQLLAAALDQFRQTQEALFNRQHATELTSLDRSMLRNCYFAIADALFGLGRYEEAVKECLAITNRYEDSPAVLEAYLQMARSYRRLDRPKQAQDALQHAKLALKRIPSQDQFAATTIYGKDQWSQLLEGLEM